jgi:NADP-dependent 3-hydroxy acid dehydrogenase YdfG
VPLPLAHAIVRLGYNTALTVEAWGYSKLSNYLDGKVIVVTGAASGFGRLVSGKASAMGARMIVGDINEAALDEVVDSLRSSNAQISGKPVDVANREAVRSLIDYAIGTFGQVDVMINNAGIMPLAFFSDHVQAADAWERCIDINFKGVLNGITAVYDQMVRQGRGHIINLSSIYGNFPVVGGAVYGATKAAVDFLSESLRQEAMGKIKVTNVKPTGVPATALGAGVINGEAVAGILGANAPGYMAKFAAAAEGKLSKEETDPDNIRYWALDPEYLADQIIHAINQPWGVSISEITVRASGDAYVI